MNNLDKQYIELLKDILENGNEKADRTGTGTLSVFGRTIRHKMSDGFPLLTTKKVHFKSIATELLWFLQGRTDLQWLLKHNNTIWVGDAYKQYTNAYKQMIEDELKILPISDTNLDWVKEQTPITKEEFIERIKTDDNFSAKHGDLGKIYGYQWRKWESYKHTFEQKKAIQKGWITPEEKKNLLHVDQVANLIDQLKNNPDSRRLMVSAWNVGDIDEMVLPPCHFGFQCYSRELSLEERMNLYFKQNPTWAMIPTNDFFDSHNIPKRALSLKWNQRSVDTPLGLPFNIASYGLLLIILSSEVNMIPDELIGDLGDTHIYMNQIEGVKEQINRDSYDLPTVFINKDKDINNISYEDIKLENYISQPKINFPLSN